MTVLLFTASLLAATLVREHLPDLPRAVGGQCAGVSNGALLVIGGSYFPAPYIEGGRKEWVDTIHILEPGAAKWKTLHLPNAVASAACATTDSGILVAGGSESGRHARRVFRVAYPSGSVTTMAVDWAGRVVIPGGEDRPGHRVAEVVAIPLEALP